MSDEERLDLIGCGVNMADIELLIKIPEEIYESSKKECDENDSLIIDTFTYAIGNGIPLPKGHGRLIDADVLVDGFEDNYEFCEVVNATPTIIEADKGEQE